MIKPETVVALNEVCHHLAVVGCNLSSAKYAFREAAYHGFKLLAKNEEKEWWELRDCLIKAVQDVGGKVELPATPAPNQVWQDPAMALNHIVKLEDAAIEKLTAAVSSSGAMHKFGKILHYLEKERAELACVVKEITNAKGGFYEVDRSLLGRYSKKCGCSKY